MFLTHFFHNANTRLMLNDHTVPESEIEPNSRFAMEKQI